MPLNLTEQHQPSTTELIKKLEATFMSQSKIDKQLTELNSGFFRQRRELQQQEKLSSLFYDITQLQNSMYYSHRKKLDLQYIILIELPNFSKVSHRKYQLASITLSILNFYSKTQLESYLDSIDSIKKYYHINTLHIRIIEITDKPQPSNYTPILIENIASDTTYSINDFIDDMKQQPILLHELAASSPSDQLPLFSIITASKQITSAFQQLILQIIFAKNIEEPKEVI